MVGKKLGDFILPLLLALVLSSNALRFLLGGSKSNALVYLTYICLFISLLIFRRKSFINNLHYNKSIKNLFFLNALVIFLGLISLTFKLFPTESFSNFFKYVVAFILSGLCIGLSRLQIKRTFIYIVLFNLLYSIRLFSNMAGANEYMHNDANYLNVTLSIGLALTICLTKTVYRLTYNFRLKYLIFYVLLTVFFFLTLIGFAARGVLLFPPLVALILTILISRGHQKKFIFIFTIFVIIIIYAINYFLTNADTYIISRFMHLVNDSGEESRIGIWSKSINGIIDNGWYIFGGGINAFLETYNFYPHNIFLHYLGEYGIVGLIFIIYSIILYVKIVINRLWNSDQLQSFYPTLCCCVGSTLYFFLTFNKSFTIYEILPLQIVYLMSVALIIELKKVKKWQNNH